MNARVLNHRKVTVTQCGEKCLCATKSNDPAFGCPLRHFAPWYGDDGAERQTMPLPKVIRPGTGFNGALLWIELEDLCFTDSLTPAVMTQLTAALPSCCSAAWKEDVDANPLPATGQFAWIVARHNAVNGRLQRPFFTVEQALQNHAARAQK